MSPFPFRSRHAVLCLGAAHALFLSASPGRADEQSDAARQAQSMIAPRYRTEVFFVQGSGADAHIDRWNYFFYDPVVPNHLRQVQIVNNAVALDQPANVNEQVSADLVFDPLRATAPVDTALKTADDYARQNQITYDQVRILLRRPSPGQAPRWRVELLDDDRSRGVVYTGLAGEFVRYAPAGAGEEATVAGFFDEVQKTFKGIGGDLQEFFTGKRTVDP